MAEYRDQAELILRGLDLPAVWEEERQRLDQLFAASGKSSADMKEPGGTRLFKRAGDKVSDSAAASSHLSQVMKTIQLKRLPSLPPADPTRRKRKRRQRVLRQRDSSTEKEEPNHVREEEEEEDAIGSSTSSDENRLELSLTFSKLIPLIWIRKIYIQYIMYKYTYFFSIPESIF